MKKTNIISFIFFLLFLKNTYSQSNYSELNIEIRKHHNYTLRIIEKNGSYSLIQEKQNENFPVFDKNTKQKILTKLTSDNDSLKEVALKSLEKLRGFKTDTVQIKNKNLINKFEKFVDNWDTIKQNINEERIVLDGRCVNITLIAGNTKKSEIKLYTPSIFNPKIASFINLFKEYYSDNCKKCLN